MNEIITRLSSIEADSAAIMEAANERKKEIADEMMQKTNTFDSQIEENTRKQLQDLRETKEADMEKLLEKQKTDSEQYLKDMEANYTAHHTRYANDIFSSMIKE